MENSVAQSVAAMAENAAGLLSQFVAPLPLLPQGEKEERELRAARQRTVDHVDGVLHAIHRDERAEARALLLAEQHLVEHVEPVERHARTAVLALLDLSLIHI